MINLSFLRHTFGSAGAGLRRHAGGHALGLLIGGGAAFSVIAAGIAFATFGGGGGGGGAGGGGGSGAAGQSTLPRTTALRPGDGGSGTGNGQPRGRVPMHLGDSEAAVAGLLQGRAVGRAPVSQPRDYSAVAIQSQHPGGGHVGGASFEASSRPMLAMASNRFDTISLGVSGGYGGRAKVAETGSSTGDSSGTGGDSGTGAGGGGSAGSGGNGTGTGGSEGSGGSGSGGNSGGSDPGSNLGGGGGGTNPTDGGTKTNPLDNVSPVPEPETYALMLAGLGLLGWQARRRKAGEPDTRR